MLGMIATMVRRRRIAFAACALGVPLLVFLALQQLTPLYTAQADVLYEPGGYAMRELQSILRSDAPTDAAIASQIEIVRSLGMAEKLLDRFGLDRSPEFNPALRHPSWPKRVLAAAMTALAGAPDPRSDRQVTAANVQHAIEAKPVKTSRVMSLGFTASDPRLAAEAANALAQLYVGEQVGLKADAVRRANAWLESRATELRAEVAAAEARIAAFREQSGLVQGVQGGLATERVSRAAADLMQARNELSGAEARAAASRRGGGGPPQAVIAPNVVALRAQRDQLGAQLAAASARLGPSHPSVAALRQQIADLGQASRTEAGRVAAAMGADAGVARARVETLQRNEETSRAEVARAAQAQLTLDGMLRDAEAARSLLRALLERAQQTVGQAAIETEDARVISRAVPGQRPSFPRTLLILPGSLALGVFLGLALAYVLEAGDESVRSGDAVRSAFSVPCLALVPELRVRPRRRIEDHILEKPLSPFSEQIRALRTGLWPGESSGGRVVAITAARPGEGKTTIAVALGRLAALNGERAIVLDCDVRQPTFGRMMQADAALGLTDCLLGQATADEIIRTDEATGLDYIPAGSPELNSLALFQSQAMVRLLDALRAQYRLVILDAPPAGVMADARVLAAAADATVMCVRWSETPRQVVENAIAALRDARAELAGIALTRVDVRAHGRAGFADSDVYQARYGGYFRA